MPSKKSPIKRGQTMRGSSVRGLVKSIEFVTNQSIRDLAWNSKHPDQLREVFTQGPGVQAALDLLVERSTFMLYGQEV